MVHTKRVLLLCGGTKEALLICGGHNGGIFSMQEYVTLWGTKGGTSNVAGTKTAI